MDASSTVGGLALPLAAGAANGGIADPTIAALLSFGGFLIKWALDARLAQQQGPAQSGEPVTDACPVDQRYPFNPETTHVRLPKPALFAWWDGASVVEQWTSIYGVRKRSIKLLYLSQEIVIPGGIAARHGVPAVVDACFCKLANELAHPGWSYGTDPLGTAITTSVGLLRLLYQSGTAGVMFEVPGNTTVADQGKTGGHVQRGYPSLMGTFQVWERVDVSGWTDPDDVQGDSLTTLRTNEQGDLADVLDIKQGYLPAADGTEDDATP